MRTIRFVESLRRNRFLSIGGARVQAGIALLVVISLSAASPAVCHPRNAQDELVPQHAALPELRSERLELACGAELVTVIGTSPSGDVPLVAVLNDTLGDTDASNDRLRYVWVFAYCAPSLRQRILSAIPFFYHGVSSRRVGEDEAPPVIFDLSKRPSHIAQQIAWYAAQAAILDPSGWLFMAGARTYRRNQDDYRRAHLMNGLSILSMFQETEGEQSELFADSDIENAYGRIVAEGLAGAFMTESQFGGAYEKHTAGSRKTVARNWELLRQRCEEEGLIFQPIPAPPAVARHAMVWVRRDAVLSSPRSRPYDGRFLNLSSPWSDESLRSWAGYTREFYEQPDGRIEGEPTVDSKPVEMIPLGVYGLDFPKIPAILVDFRSLLNPKGREISRRAMDDVSRFLLDLTPFGDLRYFVARRLFGFVVDRKGVDIAQPSRAAVATQLSALLNLEGEMDPELRRIIARDLEHLRVNPLVNRVDDEQGIARAQHRALLLQVESGKLNEQVERDRGRERAKLAHSGFANSFFATAHFLSLGLYTRREDSPQLRADYAVARSLERYAVLLEDVARAPRPVEVTWSPDRFLPALEFVAKHGDRLTEGLTASLEAIARNSGDATIQSLAVTTLASSDLPQARAAMQRLETDPFVGPTVIEVAAGRPAAPSAVRGSVPR